MMSSTRLRGLLRSPITDLVLDEAYPLPADLHQLRELDFGEVVVKVVNESFVQLDSGRVEAVLKAVALDEGGGDTRPSGGHGPDYVRC